MAMIVIWSAGACRRLVDQRLQLRLSSPERAGVRVVDVLKRSA